LLADWLDHCAVGGGRVGRRLGGRLGAVRKDLFQAGRMGQRVDFLQLADADLGVNLRGAQLGVAKHLLNEPDVGPVFQHQRGHRMPKQMATAAFTKLGGVNVFPH